MEQQPAPTFLLLSSLCFSEQLSNLTRKLDFCEHRTRVCQLAGAGDDDMSFRLHSFGLLWKTQSVVCCCSDKTGLNFETHCFSLIPVFVLELCI